MLENREGSSGILTSQSGLEQKLSRTVTALENSRLVPPDLDLDIREGIQELYRRDEKRKQPTAPELTILEASVVATRRFGERGKEQLNTIVREELGQEGLEQLSEEFKFVHDGMKIASGRTIGEAFLPAVIVFKAP